MRGLHLSMEMDKWKSPVVKMVRRGHPVPLSSTLNVEQIGLVVVVVASLPVVVISENWLSRNSPALIKFNYSPPHCLQMSACPCVKKLPILWKTRAAADGMEFPKATLSKANMKQQP